MEYYDMEEGSYPSGKKEKNENEFIGDGWSIEKIEDRYILKYLSGELQGKLKKVMISYDDFMLLKNGKISFYDFMLKNNLS
ncbi:hypothetical protein [Cloacibacterium normanense]|uniref:hypothetical protein n=1 Tax=Cloacibacterium normanense TaxID=237258 RepID=UPI00391DD703